MGLKHLRAGSKTKVRHTRKRTFKIKQREAKSQITSAMSESSSDAASSAGRRTRAGSIKLFKLLQTWQISEEDLGLTSDHWRSKVVGTTLQGRSPFLWSSSANHHLRFPCFLCCCQLCTEALEAEAPHSDRT